MHFAYLGSPHGWYYKDLCRAAAGAHRISPVNFAELTSSLGDGDGAGVRGGGIDLRSVDAVLVRTMPPSSLEQVVFRMDVLGRLEAAGGVVINPARSIETAVDKYLASAKIAAAGLKVPQTIVCQSLRDALEAFDALGGDVVVKPLFGGEGRGIVRLQDRVLAARAFGLLVQLGAVLYLQRFVPHEGFDLRVLLIGDDVLCMRRTNMLDWRTNVSCGATTERANLSADLIDTARRAAVAVKAPLAGVDLLPGRDGEVYVLEVNAAPGWKALSATLDVDVAAMVLGYLVQRAASRAAR